MNRLALATGVVLLLAFWNSPSAKSQKLDELNIQVHGYATQAFLYSTHNNWNTTDSSSGSAAWTEAVLNVTSTPDPRLRIGMQARYFVLGTLGNTVTIDWAEGDFKLSERFGFRVGKVKTPIGLLNETQDIDPAHLWILLPQSIYPLASRNSLLAHSGGVVYGSFNLGESLGKLQYRAYGGERDVSGSDGALEPYRDRGFGVPSGLNGLTYGGTLIWNTPLIGLIVGATEGSEVQSGNITYASLSGKLQSTPFNVPSFFSRYERARFMFAGEYRRAAPHGSILITGLGPIYSSVDERSYYVMSSYKLIRKLTGGAYFSSIFDLQAPMTSSRFQKDWVASGRYDINSYSYVKAEQHFMNGTLTGFSVSDNANGLTPKTKMTLLNVGVSF